MSFTAQAEAQKRRAEQYAAEVRSQEAQRLHAKQQAEVAHWKARAERAEAALDHAAYVIETAAQRERNRGQIQAEGTYTREARHARAVLAQRPAVAGGEE